MNMFVSQFSALPTSPKRIRFQNEITQLNQVYGGVAVNAALDN
jgi:hypothetical protein